MMCNLGNRYIIIGEDEDSQGDDDEEEKKWWTKGWVMLGYKLNNINCWNKIPTSTKSPSNGGKYFFQSVVLSVGLRVISEQVF